MDERVKGLFLVGGLGSRVKELGYSNKHEIPICGKPMWQYGVDSLIDVGIKEIGIVHNSNKLYDEIVKYNNDAHFYPIEQREPLGIAHAIRCARDFIDSEPFLMLLGDNIFGGGLGPFVDAWQTEHPGGVIGVSQVPDPERFGIAILDSDGRLSYIVEKPKKPTSNWAVIGAYVLDPFLVYPILHRQRPSWRGELEITDLLREMPNLRVLKIEGWLGDVGTPQSIKDAEKIICGGG